MGVFAYYDTDTEATVYHVVPSPEESAASSFPTETESEVSGVTIESDELPGYFVLHYGRQQPANNNAPKWFPSDNIRRYVLRYLVTRSLFGGDYTGPVTDVLAPIDARDRRVLEIGTRTGTWAQAMARQFPHAQFCSLDVVPMVAHTPHPNITFEVYDITEGLMVDSGSQDVVFLNYALEMVKDYQGLLREAYRVLRPGGLIHIRDLCLQLWDPEDVSIPAWRTNPRACSFVDLARQRLFAIGVDPDTCEKLPEWLAPGSDMWKQGQTGFKDIQSVTRTFPVYPHDGSPCMDLVEPSMTPCFRNLSVMCFRDTFSLARDAGVDEGEVHQLLECIVEDMKQHEQCTMFKLYSICAVKS